MRIQAINLYNNLNTNPLRKQQPTMQASAPDIFVKSPSFGNHTKLMPFFEGGIEYTPENLKKFNSILKNINLSEGVLKSLIEKAKAPFCGEYRSFTKDWKFNYDFLIRYQSADELISNPYDLKAQMFYSLPSIKVDEEISPKVEAFLNDKFQDSPNPEYALRTLHYSAITGDNLPLLKILLKDKNQYYKQYIDDEFELLNIMISTVIDGRKNPALKEFFCGDSLYNLLKDIPYCTEYRFKDPMINVELLERMPAGAEKNKCLDNFIRGYAYNHEFINGEEDIEACAMLPMSNYERELRCQQLKSKDSSIMLKHLMENRFQNIVYKNGFDAPINLLNCLKDRIMSEEMLTQKFENTTLIEEIANIPLNENNEKIMSEIMGELSKYPRLKENESYRNAGVLAAKQGNAELLKFFDSRHIHYANNLKEPIESYPKEVQEILSNAKIADMRIFDFANSPESLEKFLEDNPKVDINTIYDSGETLLTAVSIERNPEMFEYLANRDDVDLNMVDKRGDNVLMRLLNNPNTEDNINFMHKAFEILGNVSPERFDINYINTNIQKPVSVLSKILTTYHYARDQKLVDNVLKFPNIDTNLNPDREVPLVLEIFNKYSDYPNSETYKETVKKLFLHPNTNMGQISEHLDLDKLEAMDIYLEHSDLALIDKYMSQRALLEIINIYDENGFLTLDEIEKFIDCDTKENQLCHEKINIVGENIGHMLAEIAVDEDNPQEMKQLKRIFKQLQTCYYDFNSKDDFGVTPLAKAQVCENKPLIIMFSIYADED